MAAMPVASLAVTRGFGALRLGQNDKVRSGVFTCTARKEQHDGHRTARGPSHPAHRTP